MHYKAQPITMRPLSRYEPVTERRHLVFDTKIVESKRVHEEYVSKTSGKHFDQYVKQDLEKELQELGELRSYFVSASCNKHCTPHPSLKEISSKLKQKGKSFRDFLMMLF